MAKIRTASGREAERDKPPRRATVLRRVVRKRNPEELEGRRMVKQTKLQGDGFPEEPPEDVCKARDEFLSAIRSAAKASKSKSSKHERLVTVMKEHKLQRIPLDGENKFFELEEEEKVKLKTVPKDERTQRAAAAK